MWFSYDQKDRKEVERQREREREREREERRGERTGEGGVSSFLDIFLYDSNHHS